MLVLVIIISDVISISDVSAISVMLVLMTLGGRNLDIP